MGSQACVMSTSILTMVPDLWIIAATMFPPSGVSCQCEMFHLILLPSRLFPEHNYGWISVESLSMYVNTFVVYSYLRKCLTSCSSSNQVWDTLEHKRTLL